MPKKAKVEVVKAGENKPKRSAFDKILENLQRMDGNCLEQFGEKLAKERALTEGILKGLKEAVLVIDRAGNIELINPSAEAMLELPPIGEDGKRPTLFRGVPELAKLLKVSSDGLIHDFSALSVELEISYPQPRAVRLQATPLEGLDRLLIVLRDITHEKERTHKELEEAQLHALTQLAAGVAHELGNPLNALEIHLQLLERSLQKEKLSQGGEKIARNLKVAQGELKRLDQIIRHFLEAIRPTPPDLKPSDIMAALEEVLTVLRAEFEGAKIKVKVEVSGILPMIAADLEQLKQVYFNLLKNAREAMEEGGLLQIRAEMSDSELILSFIDSGKGISAEGLTRLFEPYSTTKKSGTGLGLMIAQKIMRAHGGHIAVESREGSGTIVKLIFPTRYRRLRPLTGRATPQPQLPKPQA